MKRNDGRWSIRAACSKAGLAPALEGLEPRRLMTITLASPIDDVSVRPGATDGLIALGGRFTTNNLADVTGTVVSLPAGYGSNGAVGSLSSAINIELYDSATPLSAQNFVNYVNSGRYDNSFFSDANPGVSLVAGGYTFTNGAETAVPGYGNVPSEFQQSPRSAGDKVNVRGTVALVRNDQTNPNSATSTYVINLGDNSSIFDGTSFGSTVTGYTVFGRVIGGLSAADQIAALPRYSLNSSFTRLPVFNYDGRPGDITLNNLASISDPAVIASPQNYFTYRVVISNSKVATGTLDSSGNLDLKYAAKASGTTTVTYTATDLTGASRSDSFTVTVAAPALAVTFGTTKVTNAQATPVDLGTVFLSQTATSTFVIKNTGKGLLNLGDVSLPEGLTLATPLPATLAAGTAANLALNVDTSTIRTIAGTISIGNDVTAGAFTIPVTVSVGTGVRLGGTVKSVVFIDAGSTKVTLGLKGSATGQLGFAGAGLNAVTAKGVTTVTGMDSAGSVFGLTTIALSGTSKSTTLSATVKGGDNLVFATGLSADGYVGSVSLKGLGFASGISIPGGVSALTSGPIIGGSTVIGPAGTVVLGALSGATVSFTGNVKSLLAPAASNGLIYAAGTISAATFAGTLSNETVLATGSIVKLSAQLLNNAYVGAGALPGNLIGGAPIGGTSVGQLTLTGKGIDLFSGSTIKALTIGKLSLGQLTAAGAGSRIAATLIGSLMAKGAAGDVLTLKAVTSASGAADAAAAKGVPAGRLSFDFLNG